MRRAEAGHKPAAWRVARISHGALLRSIAVNPSLRKRLARPSSEETPAERPHAPRSLANARRSAGRRRGVGRLHQPRSNGQARSHRKAPVRHTRRRHRLGRRLEGRALGIEVIIQETRGAQGSAQGSQLAARDRRGVKVIADTIRRRRRRALTSRSRSAHSRRRRSPPC